jgi:choline dehydrogenase-like flavoprotein
VVVSEPGIVQGRDLGPSALSLDVDAVVVGTGAGGSVALRELARAGLSVVALEEGALLTPADFDQREDRMLPQLYQDGGGRTTEDLAIRVLQGRGVGGSTVHNTNLCKRTPTRSSISGQRKYGVVGAVGPGWSPSFESIERDLSVTEIARRRCATRTTSSPQGCEALGWRGAPLKHNRVGCTQSGFCELGCAYDAKQNALKVVMPQAVRAGARVYADVEAVRLVHDGRRAGVRGVARGGTGARDRRDVRARVVVLAASAVGSAALARRSGVPDPARSSGAASACIPARSSPGGSIGRSTGGAASPRATSAPSTCRSRRAATARLDRPGVRAPDRRGRDAARLRRRAHGGHARVPEPRGAHGDGARRDERRSRRRRATAGR